ncbi:MAG TPA: hypothetical protein VMZ92_08740 [Planctomycetota bacterium]|nr:hypothetical protein [Planctomycetota bacterium]
MRTSSWVMLGIIAALALAVIVLVVINYTPWAVPAKYPATPPIDWYGIDEIIATEKAIWEDPENVNRGGGGSSHKGGLREAYEREHNAEGVLKKTGDADPRRDLLAAVQHLNGVADFNGFALLPYGFRCRTFGQDRTLNLPDVKWRYDLQAIHGPEGSVCGTTLPGRMRYVYVSLTYAHVENLAVQFNWTFILDVKTGQTQLYTGYSGMTPLYTGPEAPKLYRLELTASK